MVTRQRVCIGCFAGIKRCRCWDSSKQRRAMVHGVGFIIAEWCLHLHLRHLEKVTTLKLISNTKREGKGGKLWSLWLSIQVCMCYAFNTSACYFVVITFETPILPTSRKTCCLLKQLTSVHIFLWYENWLKSIHCVVSHRWNKSFATQQKLRCWLCCKMRGSNWKQPPMCYDRCWVLLDLFVVFLCLYTNVGYLITTAC